MIYIGHNTMNSECCKAHFNDLFSRSYRLPGGELLRELFHAIMETSKFSYTCINSHTKRQSSDPENPEPREPVINPYQNLISYLPPTGTLVRLVPHADMVS